MYADYAARLVREKWSALARRHLSKPNPTNEELQQALVGLADGLDSLAEEMSVLLRKDAPLTHRSDLTVVRGGIQSLTPPPKQWPVPPIASSDTDVQACQYNLSGTTPSALLLTFSGTPTNGSCESCIDLINGGPYILDQDPDNPCRYTYSGEFSCDDLALDLTMSSNSIVGTVTIGVVPEAQIAFTVEAPYDGSGSRTTTLSNISVSHCDLTDIQATIVGANAAAIQGGMNAQNIDEYYALFRALNWGAYYDCDTKTIYGGLAGIFKGPVYMDQIICPDGTCLNCSEVANTVTNFKMVTRSGGTRIIQDDDGNYVLQDHLFRDLVVNTDEDLGWVTSHTFPTMDISGEMTWDQDGNKKIQQVMNASVSVVGLGTASTADVLEATYVSQFVKDVKYDIYSHILWEAGATDVYVLGVGVPFTRIIDIAEPCSGDAEPPSFGYADADMSIGAATMDASATFAPDTYSAESAMTVGGATMAATATFAGKTVTGSAAMTVGAATLSGTATLPVEHTGTAELTAPAATCTSYGPWDVEWTGGFAQFVPTSSGTHADYSATMTSNPGIAAGDMILAVTATAAQDYDITQPGIRETHSIFSQSSTMRETGHDLAGFAGHHLIVSEHQIESGSVTPNNAPLYYFATVDPVSADLACTLLLRMRRGVIAFGSASSLVEGVDSLDVEYPTGIQVGDLLVIVLTYESDGDVFLPEATGFDGVNGEDSSFGISFALADGVNACVLLRVADGTETGTVTVNAVGPTEAGFTWYGCQGFMLRYS